MGREVRRVPKDWQHPKDGFGRYVPLHGRSYLVDVAEWDEEYAQWQRGYLRNYGKGSDKYVPKDEQRYHTMPYSEWNGRRPDEADYMPDWAKSERTHLQMYENTSEGTPISPVMETPEQLARWLVDNGASACGSMTATYEQWLAMAKAGWAPTMMFSPQNGLVSGVEAAAKEKP